MAAGPSIGVNVYLWRAALETIDFMPLVQADPFGGVIITDWFSPPETPGERFKLTIYILDRELRADAVKVAVFRQIKGDGGWTDATVEPDDGNRHRGQHPDPGARAPHRRARSGRGLEALSQAACRNPVRLRARRLSARKSRRRSSKPPLFGQRR